MSLNLSRTFGPAGVLASSPWNRAAKQLSFRTQRYARNGMLLPLNQMATFSRPLSPAERINIAGDGLLAQVAPDVPRIDSRGYLPEAAAVGQPVNSLLLGAVAGSPGTLPSVTFSSVPAGLSRTVTLGTTNGISWCEIEYSGTTSSAGAFIVQFGGGFAALNGQTWRGSAFASVTGSDITSLTLSLAEDNASSVFLAGNSTDWSASRTVFGRKHHTRVLNQAATAFVRNSIGTNTIASGVTLAQPVRIRFGLQMLNQGELTSPILTTNSGAITRAGDVLSVPINDIGAGADWTLCGVARMPLVSVSASHLFTLGASAADMLVFRRGGADPSILIAQSVVGGNGQSTAGAAPGLVAPGAFFGFSVRRAGPTFGISINGGAPINAIAGLMPTLAPTVLAVGHTGIGGSQFNGEIAEMLQFGGAANDATMQAYSTPSTWGAV
jgi:hypothetical protein